MKYYLVAGEASGDLHASNLMKGILNHDSQAQFRLFGGDLMAAVGGQLAKHYREMAFMGFLEVILNLRTISKNLKKCKNDILEFNPDVLILVDYPGFNLRIAKFAKTKGYKVFYYIAPKVWAWKESRVEKLKMFVDHLFVIFPFEISYFAQKGINAIFEGNPTLDAIQPYISNKEPFNDFVKANGLSQKPIVTLMAGSRKQEIKHNLPYMLTLVKHFPGYQFVIAGAPSLTPMIYEPYLRDTEVKLIYGKGYQVVSHSTLAVVTSGTATLEVALLNVPEVVCYRGGFISMLIAWMVVKVKYISLVNLIMGREVVRELLQYDLNPKTLLEEVRDILPGEHKREAMLAEYNHLSKMVGQPGASDRFAKRMVDLLKPNS
jgi:lipid-A-disaccharide synthase